MKFNRRTFIALGTTTGLLGLYWLYKWHYGDPAEVVVSILKRRVGYLRVQSSSFYAFAKDYLEFRKEYEKDLKKLSVVSFPLQFLSPYAWLDQGHAFRRLEDNVVSKFLLSTDFFQNGANDRTLVTYLSFYDPQRAVCRNPLARRA